MKQERDYKMQHMITQQTRHPKYQSMNENINDKEQWIEAGENTELYFGNGIHDVWRNYEVKEEKQPI